MVYLSVQLWLKWSSTETETVIQEDKAFATVAYWRIKSAELVEKPSPEHTSPSPSAPPLLDSISEQIYVAAVEALPDSSSFNPPKIVSSGGIVASSTTRRGRWIAIGNVLSDYTQPVTIEEETSACFEKLKGTLSLVLKE
jgi:diphthine-ammonia ligase